MTGARAVGCLRGEARVNFFRPQVGRTHHFLCGAKRLVIRKGTSTAGFSKPDRNSRWAVGRISNGGDHLLRDCIMEQMTLIGNDA